MLLLVDVGLLKHVGPRATHFTGYSCWVYVAGASGNTFYWVLLLVYVGSRATHFAGYCCWFTWGPGQHTLLDLMWTFSNGFKIIFYDEVEVSISESPRKLLIKQLTPSQTISYATTSLFPN
jgi:hypothetical protein